MLSEQALQLPGRDAALGLFCFGLVFMTQSISLEFLTSSQVRDYLEKHESSPSGYVTEEGSSLFPQHL